MNTAWIAGAAVMVFVALPDSRMDARLESVLAKNAWAVTAVSSPEGAFTVFRGTFTAELRTKRGSGVGTVELTVGAPDRWAVSWASPGPGGVTAEASTRGSGWSNTWNGLHHWTPDELLQKRLDAGPWLGTPLKSAYSSVKWIGEEPAPDGGSVAVLEAMPAEGSLPDKLFLDEASGLLLRRDATRTVWIVDDLSEDVSLSYRYDDYRDVFGNKRPFRVRLEAPLIGYEVTFTESALAESVSESRFEPPP